VVLADYNKSLLMLLVYREARGEGPEGMRAVAHVVQNRVRRGWGDWIAVQTKINQFSSMSVLGDSQTVVFPDAAAASSLFGVVEAVYGSSDADPTSGALYYANEAVVGAGWYRTHIIENPAHPITATIGRHTFRA
jgi:spore germination cell wall hydrolase CwlJ-like protein